MDVRAPVGIHRAALDRRNVLIRTSSAQPANGVPIPSFKGAPGDGQLLAVAAPLVTQLAAQGDVRPTLERHFRMAAWFQRRLRARSV